MNRNYCLEGWYFRGLCRVSLAALAFLVLLSCDPPSSRKIKVPLSCDPPSSRKIEVSPVKETLAKDKTHVLVVTNIGSTKYPFSKANIVMESKNAGQMSASFASNHFDTPAFFSIPERQITYAQMPALEELPTESPEARQIYNQGPQYQKFGEETYNEGDVLGFNVQIKHGVFKNRTFTLRKKDTNDSWTVHYWVDNDAWREGNTVPQDDFVGRGDINDIADKFSREGQILDTSINIYGPPWGIDAYGFGNLIPETTKGLHVLIYDINLEEAGERGGWGKVRGYFWLRDNMTNLQGSNKKLVITIDAPNLSRWKSKTYGVLIHEFNHMITFYQKRIKRGSASAATWLTEMMAQMATDLVSDKLRLEKSHKKMIASHLHEPWESLIHWCGTVKDYHSVTHFGAFLLRSKYTEYGQKSVELARHIQNNRHTDYKAITHAIRQLKGSSDSWGKILRTYATQAIKGHTAKKEDSFLKKKLEPIEPFKLIKDGYGINGIPMFALSRNGKMPYVPPSGELIKYESRYPKRIKAPEPGGFIYVYLGKFEQDAVLKLTLPSGLKHDIVPL